MYFKMNIIVKIIRLMKKITKCPIFLEAISFLIASKTCFFIGFLAQYFVTFFIEHPVWIQFFSKSIFYLSFRMFPLKVDFTLHSILNRQSVYWENVNYVTTNKLTLRPKIWLIAADSFKVHSAWTIGLISWKHLNT